MKQSRNLTFLRWICLFSVGLGELMWLSVRIKTPSNSLLSYTEGLPYTFVTSLAVAMGLGWVRRRGRLLDLAIFHESTSRYWALVIAQLGAFGAFSWLTIYIFEKDISSSSYAVLCILAWATMGFASCLFWCVAGMPARAWIRLLKQNSSLVSVAIVVFIASWVLRCLATSDWGFLQDLTLSVVQWLLYCFHQDVVYVPSVKLVGTRLFDVTILPACSGYDGIGLMAVFMGIYFLLFRRGIRFPQAFVLLPFAVVTMWLVNAIRITSLILIGAHLSPEIANGGFHSQSGWLSFVGVAFGIVALAQRVEFFSGEGVRFDLDPEVEIRNEANGPNVTVAHLGPLMALLALAMITGMFNHGFDWLYPAQVLGTAIVIWILWHGSVNRVDLNHLFSWGAIGLGAAVFVIWMLLEKALGGPDAGSAIANDLVGSPYGLAAIWLIFRVLGSVVTVPIAEELAFRGYLLRRFLSRDFERVSTLRFTWLSFLGSSVLYGALHGRWLAGMVAGMMYAWAMYRRGRVTDAIIAHATTNALIALAVLVFGYWGLWN